MFHFLHAGRRLMVHLFHMPLLVTSYFPMSGYNKVLSSCSSSAFPYALIFACFTSLSYAMMISVAAVAIRSGSNNNNGIQKPRKTLIFTRAKACVFVCRDPDVDVGGECGNARQDKSRRVILFT